jgi:hypothetical protein
MPLPLNLKNLLFLYFLSLSTLHIQRHINFKLRIFLLNISLKNLAQSYKSTNLGILPL